MIRVAEHVARTDTGHQRATNEDSYLERAPIFVIADGMGGAQAGEVASRMAITHFEEGLPGEESDGAEQRLARAVHEANSEIHELSEADARLIVERAPGHTPGMIYDIGQGAVLGRGDIAEIRLEDPFASSRHAQLLLQGGVVVLEDLGSTNGTYLNEELLAGPAPLHNGDRVRIGDSEFTYEEG